MATRIVLRDVTTDGTGVRIGRVELIDGESGEVLRIAKATPELCELLATVEIDAGVWQQIQDMKRKQPGFTRLIETFKLYT